jgi:signal transduction histidine kinase
MAASTLGDRVREFQQALPNGLRRATLDQFVAQTQTAAQIMVRNLERAAELVTSFKQVAVDRASAQRRTFDLREMIQEILLTLQPTLKRTPHQVVVDAPAGLRLDSYPGPLGQALTNLINNAVLHAFEDGQGGIIRIIAHSAEEGRIRIEVRDNGKGIPAELLKRIFNPFVTTRLGRGGTGLGLHIAYNAITNILGGRLTVHSEEGSGAEFEIWLPEHAPPPAAAESS